MQSASNAWNVPVTWIANISSADVVDSNLPELDVSDSNTKEGWRQEGSILYISVLAGNEVI